jgi:hypothetical protein
MAEVRDFVWDRPSEGRVAWQLAARAWALVELGAAG